MSDKIDRDATLYVTPIEVARVLGFAQSDIYRILTEGGIPAIRVGVHWKIAKSTLDGMMEAATAFPLPLAPDEASCFAEVHSFIKEATSLPERFSVIALLRFGPRLHTLEATAKRVGVTRERVRQAESRMLRLIRRSVLSGKVSARDVPMALERLNRVLLAAAIEEIKRLQQGG